MRCKMIYVNEINGAAILGGGIVFWMTDATKGHGITSVNAATLWRSNH